MRILGVALLLSSVLFLFPCSGGATVETSTNSFSTPSTYFRMSLMSSSSSLRNDFRSLKSTGTEDGESMNENTVSPNLNYLSGMGIVTLGSVHRLSFAGLQALDSREDR